MPSPNDHAHDVGVLVDASVNATSPGAPVVRFAENAATGAAEMAARQARGDRVQAGGGEGEAGGVRRV